ncbi:MAG: tRNA lysidine(34) synthetase TilS [Dehalococcoidia bacterium]
MASADSAIATRKRLEQRVRAFMLRRELWPDEARLVVAVSGGPDSTALLLLLSRLAKNRTMHMHVATFDHTLRPPKVIEQEIAFVHSICDRLGLAFTHGKGDVAVRAREDGTSIEDAARRERYEFLARVAHEDGATHVATGHTASDQAETVLLHIIRGSGLDGLGAMAPSTPWPLPGAYGLTLIRPILPLTREETREYCTASDVEPAEDETNDSPDYLRNRVRHELLPLLQTFNPRIEDALLRLAAAARESASPQPVRDALSAVAGDTQGFSARHIEAIEGLLRQGRTGDRLSLPRSLVARRTREGVLLEAATEPVSLPPDELLLAAGSEARWGTLDLLVSDTTPPDDATAVEVDADAVARLRVRRWQAGDRLQPSGMDGTKKLQDLFVDLHVPREERERIPIFESERGIVWVGGLRLAEWAKPRPGRPTCWLSYRHTV